MRKLVPVLAFDAARISSHAACLVKSILSDHRSWALRLGTGLSGDSQPAQMGLSIRICQWFLSCSLIGLFSLFCGLFLGSLLFCSAVDRPPRWRFFRHACNSRFKPRLQAQLSSRAIADRPIRTSSGFRCSRFLFSWFRFSCFLPRRLAASCLAAAGAGCRAVSAALANDWRPAAQPP